MRRASARRSVFRRPDSNVRRRRASPCRKFSPSRNRTWLQGQCAFAQLTHTYTKLSNLRKASCFTQVDQKTILKKKKKLRASRLARESSRGQDAWVMGQNVFPSYEDVKSLDKYARFLLSACLTSSNKHLVTHHYPSATELRGDQFARPSAVRRTGCDAVSLFGDN